MNRRTTRSHPGRSGVSVGLPLLAFALALAACGGGGAGGGGTPIEGPTALSYGVPDAMYRVDGPIDPNTPIVQGGEATGFGVSPVLPSGLALDADTGVITGTPLQPEPRREYTVTAANEAGQIAGRVTIEVRLPKVKSLALETGLDDADLRHFLIRTHWGVTADKLADLQAQGLSAFLDDMLQFPAIDSTIHEQQAALLLRRSDDPPGQEGMFPYHSLMIRWWLHLMKENPNPFQEVLAYMWHDHFATSSEVLGGGRNYYMVKHVNMLREHGNGNVRELLLEISRDWAMLWWLDGRNNTKYAPNENFSREWFELFSLGVDNGYMQQDIEEAARAFTGWQDLTLDEDTGLRYMKFVATRHDVDDKTILGVTIPGQNADDDFEAVVNLTIDNGQVAEWLALRLLSWFCCPDPSQELIDQLAQVLRDADYELVPTLKALFLSEAFFADESRGSLIKGPVEHALGFMRSTEMWVRVNEVQAILQSQGNIPTQPPTVDGWPGGAQWLSAQGMVDRANFLQIANAHSQALSEQQAKGTDLRDLLPPGPPTTSIDVVDALAIRLGVVLDDTERTRLAEYLDTDREGNGTVVPSPFDPTNQDHIDERVRGLLYVLGQHPTYMVR